MKYLLDTHVILWVASNSPYLSEKAKQIILDITNEKYVSIASAWEVAIKLSSGKLMLEGGISEFFRIIDENGFVLLPISKRHIEKVAELPFYHRDPFDRLLIAAAMSENMHIVSIDENFHFYDVMCDW